MHPTRILELFEEGKLDGSSRLRIQEDAEPRPLRCYIRELVWIAHRAFSGQTTERTQPEQTLFQAAFSNAPVGMVVSDLAGRITNANGSFARMLGYRPRELEGLRVGQLSVDTDGRQREVELGNELMAGHRDSFQVEKEFVARDGRRVETLTAISVARDAEGAPVNVVAHVLDLTEQRELRLLNQAIKADRDTLDLLNLELERRVKERTKQLQASELRFSSLFEYAPQAMLIANSRGQVVQYNAVAKELFAEATGDLASSWVRTLLPDLESVWEQLANEESFACSGAETAIGEGARWGVVGAVPVRLHGETHALVGIQEVTDAKVARAELADSLAVKNTLLREVHHRVKNNLQVVSSLLAMQSEELSDDESKRVFRESVSRVRAIALVHEFLYRVDTLAHVNMRQYGATLAQTLRNLHNPNVRVVFDGVDVDLPIETAVPVALIMNEALTNAFKYGIPEEPDRRGSLPEILLAMRVEGDKFVLEVRDYGRGMASELCKNPGTSLGVQIMQSLSRQIRGEASWSNESGTVFRLSIALPEHSKVR